MPFIPEEGRIPRVMMGARKGIEAVRIVVVAKCPGNPAPAEKELWPQAIKGGTDRLLEAMTDWGEKCHCDPETQKNLGGNSRYHKGLMKFLQETLNCSCEKVLDQVYFTELLKCSMDNEDERESVLSNKYRSYTKKCIRNWLVNELDLFPKHVVAVALGNEVYNALLAHTTHRVFYLRHPTVSSESIYNEARKRLQKLLADENLPSDFEPKFNP